MYVSTTYLINCMILTTKNKELAILGQTITSVKQNLYVLFDAFQHGGIKGQGGIIDTFFSRNQQSSLTPELLQNFEMFKEKFNNSSLSAEVLNEQMENVDHRIVEYAKTCKNGEMTTKGFKASLESMSLSAKAGKIALHALAMAGNMLLMWGISEVIQLTVKGIQYLTSANERLMKAQQDIIDKANENIQKYDDEISSLEKLQSKLEDSKNSKEALAKIQSELNNAIGFTPGLLNNESGAWNAANQKIADRIARLKELRKEELNRKIVAEKKQFDNAEIANKNGIDKNFDFYLNTKVNNTGIGNMRIKNKYDKYLDGLELDTKKTVTIKDIYATLKKNGYGEGQKSDAQIFATIIKDFYGGTLKGVNSKEIQKYFDKQTKRAQQYFIDTGIFEDYSGAFAQEELNTMIAKLVEGGYASDLEGIANVMDEIMNNDELPKLIDEYYKSLFDKSKDSDVLYQQIEEQFNELTQKYPMLKSILDNIFNSISKDIENNVEQSLQTSFFDKLIAIKEKMDTLTSSASSLSSALTTLYSGDYNSSDLLSSIMTINSAISQFGEDVSVDWENITSLDQLQEVVMGLSETYAKSILSDAGISTKNNPFAEMIQNSIAESIKLKAQLDGVNNALDSLQGNYKTLTDTIDTYNKYGYITIDQLQSLLEMDDKYLSCMVDENGQLNLNKTTYSNLAKIQLENAKATALTQYNSEVARIKQEALARANQNLGLSIGLENGGLIGKLNDLSGEFTLLSKVMSVAKNIFGKIKNTFNEQKSKSQIDFDNRLLDKQAKKWKMQDRNIMQN